MPKLQKLLQAGSVACAMTIAAHAADPIKLDIKPGLWQVTRIPQISGQMPIPEEQLAKLTPEQRSKLEAAMQAGLNSARKTRVYKECMTQEKISRGLDLDKKELDASCKRTVLASTPTELKMHDECTHSNGKSIIDVHIQVSNQTKMDGTVDVVMHSGAQNMKATNTLTGRWIAPDCGTVKDSELVEKDVK